MNFSSITNSSDVVDYSGDIVGPLEFNCSQYEFGKEPPNVTQHFDGIIVQKFISINRFKLSIILKMNFIFPALGVVGLGFAYGGTASSGLLTLIFLIQICSNVRKCPWEWQRPLSWISKKKKSRQLYYYPYYP
jgi:hypothetical protein